MAVNANDVIKEGCKVTWLDLNSFGAITGGMRYRSPVEAQILERVVNGLLDYVLKQENERRNTHGNSKREGQKGCMRLGEEDRS